MQKPDKKTPFTSFFPLGIDMTRMPCLVVGGGRIGTRKALALLQAGADVTILSPQVSEELEQEARAGRLTWINGIYNTQALEGCMLVVAATYDPALNAEIVQDADRRRILSCAVSPRRASRVIFPAILETSDMVVAVHSNGTQPSKSRRLRDRVAAFLAQDRAPQPVVVGIRPQSPLLDGDRSVHDILPHWARCLLLNTCRRWELWLTSSDPQTAAGDIAKALSRKSSQQGQSDIYIKTGATAMYHMLRVATGLDSNLTGETDIVHQIKNAEAQLTDRDDDLRQLLAAVLTAQRGIRGRTRVGEGVNWSNAVTSLLAGRLGGLAGRRVAFAGCGKLAQTTAEVLAAQKTHLLAFSKRDRVEWCRAAEIEVHSYDSLPCLMPGLDALIVTGDPGAAAGYLETYRGSVLIVDLRKRGLPATSCAAGLDTIRHMPSTGREAARVAVARQEVLIEALKYHSAIRPPEPLHRPLTIGGRPSALSRVQLKEAERILRAISDGITIRQLPIVTIGDRDKKTPIAAVDATDFFTREVDDALLRGEIDIAVHSAKDLPDTVPPGLMVAAFTPTAGEWECLIAAEGMTLASLPPNAVLGISSQKRRDMIRDYRPDLRTADVRGTVPQRLNQLEAGKYDGLILAAIGLIRLGCEDRISEILLPDRFPPHPLQGSLAFVIRSDDEELKRLLEPLTQIGKI